MNTYFDSSPRHHRSPWFGRVQIDGKRTRTPYRASAKQVEIDVRILRLATDMERAGW